MSRVTFPIVPLSAPHFSEKNNLFMAPDTWPELVPRFEAELMRATGATYALATQSGTSALELALRTVGIEPGDTVICPTLTFAATANAIANVGAVPVFVDSEPASWGLDPDALKTAVQKQPQSPKAIVVVDLYGMPARWNELRAVAEYFAIPLIADAAQSLGSFLNGQACGTLGLLNAVSFNVNKIITTFGGGGLLTNGQVLATKVGVFANQGRRTEPPHEQVTTGGNYRMNPLAAQAGLCQVSELSERVQQRRAIFSQYERALSHCPGIQFQVEEVGAISNRWLTALTIDPQHTAITRDQLAEDLGKAGIATRSVFAPLHQQRAFRHCAFYGSSVADKLAQTGLCLPSGSGLTDEELYYVIYSLQNKFGCR